MFACVLILALVIALGAWITRARGWRVGVPWGLATALLGLAWIDPHFALFHRPQVALFVDVSPSTRGLWFRDRQTITLIEQSLRSFAEVDTFVFADGNGVSLSPDSPVVEMDAQRSSLPGCDADAIVLLSDGQVIEPTSRVPVFPVINSVSRASGNARIRDAIVDRGSLVVRIENDGGPRQLTWPDGAAEQIARGDSTLRHELAALNLNDELSIALNTGDLWPEDDRIAIPIVRDRSERLWIGGEAPDGFSPRAVESMDIPALLGASVIVLDDLPIQALPMSFQDNLARYVRDFGGGLVIGGGAHALGAGGYGNTPIDALSPLASLPPSPIFDLFLIVDASGSMGTLLPDGRPRLDVAIDAMHAIDRIIPLTWSLRAGSIARDLRWWPATNARIARPADLLASGPTNLAEAVEQVANLRIDSRNRLILISDGQVDAASLSAISPHVLKTGLTIDWLALPPADEHGPLAQLVRAAGGQILVANDAGHWRGDAEALARHAIATPLISGPFDITLPPLGTATASQINQTYLRDGATPIAVAIDKTPFAATWNVGVGQVTTLAFKLDPTSLGTFALSHARPAHDPRFTSRLSRNGIEVDARDARGPMNFLSLALQLDRTAIPFEQIAPGQFRAAIDRCDFPRVATIRLGQAVIDLIPIPARAAQEFDSIGVDFDSLKSLADSSGGKLLRSDEIKEIGSLFVNRPTDFRVPVLLGAMLLIIAALLAARRAASN